jgi:hypothetical protein
VRVVRRYGRFAAVVFDKDEVCLPYYTCATLSTVTGEQDVASWLLRRVGVNTSEEDANEPERLLSRMMMVVDSDELEPEFNEHGEVAP